MASYPRIDLDTLKNLLSPEDYDVVKLIVGTRGDANGRLRANKPKQDPNDPNTGLASYVWRMVAFTASPDARHHCMPCTADFDITMPGFSYRRATREDVHRQNEYRKAQVERGDAIEKIVVFSIAPIEWHGTRRWGQVYGMTGTPRYNDEGAVIYR